MIPRLFIRKLLHTSVGSAALLVASTGVQPYHSQELCRVSEIRVPRPDLRFAPGMERTRNANSASSDWLARRLVALSRPFSSSDVRHIGIPVRKIGLRPIER